MQDEIENRSGKKRALIGLCRPALVLFLFIFAFVAIAKLFRFMLDDDVHYYTRVMMHELYKEPDIEALFVGSSHCFRSIDPALADPLLNEKTFNAGSSHQCLDGSYALIRECAARNDLKEVYVELFYGTNQDSFIERNSMTGTYILSDYMHPSLRKLSYLLNASAPRHYVNSFLIAARERERLSDPEEIFKTVKEKCTAPYLGYTYEYLKTEEEEYLGRGYVASYEENPEGGFCHEPFGVVFRGNTLSEDSKKCIRKIIDLCDSRGIRVSFFSSPMPDFRLAAIGGYDEYIKEVREVLNGTSARYYDFNLCREEYLSLSETDYMDSGHLNGAGAEKFTPVFAGFFSGKLSEEELFCGSYEEKLSDMGSRLLGFIWVREPEHGLISLKTVWTGEPEEINLEVDLRPDPVKKDPLTGKELSRKLSLKGRDFFYVSYPPGEKGLITLDAFLDGKVVNHCYFGY